MFKYREFLENFVKQIGNMGDSFGAKPDIGVRRRVRSPYQYLMFKCIQFIISIQYYSFKSKMEYRLDIKGISTFCPCGELLWLFDGSSIDILRKHFRKCRLYAGIKNFPYKKVVQDLSGNHAMYDPV